MDTSDASSSPPPVELLSWSALTSPGASSPAVLASIARAFGPGGLGLLAVSGVPHFSALRAAALPQAHAFGQLPEAVKARYVDAASQYSFGWSHGKEKLEGGRLDTAKGSYYANPMHDAPFAEHPEVVAAHLPFASANIWPSDEDAPGFAAAYKALACAMVEAGAVLAVHVDAYVRSVRPSYPPPGAPAGPPGGGGDLSLAGIVSHGRCHKARLLYYFPPEAGGSGGVGEGVGGEAEPERWCGWHNGERGGRGEGTHRAWVRCRHSRGEKGVPSLRTQLTRAAPAL